jgi:beta-lactamase class A
VSRAAERIDRLAAEHDADLSVWMGAFDGTPWLIRDAERVLPAASTMKLPLLVALHSADERGGPHLEDQVRVRAVLDSVVPGHTYETTQDYDNDDAPWERLGRQASLRWLGERAIVSSSNLATNLLLDVLGLDSVNAVYRDVGATDCAVRRGIQDSPGGEAGLSNTVTASGLAAVMLGVAGRRLASEPACEEVERVLAACEHRDAIGAALPAGTYLANKTGWIDDHTHDVALVRPSGEAPFVLVVLSHARLDDDAGHRLVADVAAACWEDRSALAKAAS